MAIELLTKRWAYPGSASVGKILIDDSENGDGGFACRQFPGEAIHEQQVETRLKIDSIPTGRVRWRVGGNAGTWRSMAADYFETITAGNGDEAAIEYDPFTVATIDEETLSVAIPEE